jgi:hypothetical protein
MRNTLMGRTATHDATERTLQAHDSTPEAKARAAKITNSTMVAMITMRELRRAS